ncbi:MAG: hypothetical protein M1828_006903 [Chrysothrix sp. TS-e1954]|nr:MAG: hypothetical protein M1828_006903 [Chrysothrix sp. TS-e1954]
MWKGFPYPDNLNLARHLETVVRENGAVPATVGVLDSIARVGMSESDIKSLVERPGARKLSRRDLALATVGIDTSKPLVDRDELIVCDSKAHNETPVHGGTTIAGTMILAHLAGIKVFATGGLGGVHRGGEASLDISADLTELGRTPVAVICSGCKGFLDIPRTLEYLETQGVCVATFAEGRMGDVDFPAFWSRESGVKSPASMRDEVEAAGVIYAQSSLSIASGMLFASPVPAHASISREVLDSVIERAVQAASEAGATGSSNTPFILDEIKRLTGGRSVDANTALVEANLARGARVAVELSKIEISRHGGAAYRPGQISPGVRHATKGATSDQIRASTLAGESTNEFETMDVLVAGSIASDISCNYLPSSNKLDAAAPLPNTSNPAKIEERIGGVGFNIWRSVNEIGVQAGLCSVIGKDIAGDSLRRSLERYKCSTKGIKEAEDSNKTTSRYVAMNDAHKDLVIAMADMSIMETPSQNFDTKWLPHLRSLTNRTSESSAQQKWLILDANWDSETLHRWIAAAKAHGIATAFEPVSMAKAGRIFERGLDYELPRVVDIATPNALELEAMYESAQRRGLLEREDWWRTIDTLGISSSGARSELIRVANIELYEQGIPQRSIQLLPFIPNLLTTLGSRGVLLTRILLKDDEALTSPASAPYVISRSKSEGPIGGLYMRLFAPSEDCGAEAINTVNGAGDAFCGSLIGLLAQAQNPRVEDVVDQSQAASLRILKGLPRQ